MNFQRSTAMASQNQRSVCTLLLCVGCALLITHRIQAAEPIFEPGAELTIESENGSGGEGPAWHPKLGLLTSGNGDIYQLDRDGKLLDFLPVPRDEVTNCAFGGADLKTLYITAGGTLFSIRTATAGRVVWPAE